MAKLVDIEAGVGIRDLIDEMKSLPSRLDKDMRTSFRKLAIPARDEARARAARSRPDRKTRKHKGSYNWKKLVNAIQSSADDDSPTLNLGSSRVPGWAGWEFGSDRLANFPRRTPKGRFFFPTIEELLPDMNEATQKVVDSYIDLFAKI